MPFVRRRRRAGIMPLEVVMTAAVGVPGAAALYVLYETVMNHYMFLVGGSVGCPVL